MANKKMKKRTKYAYQINFIDKKGKKRFQIIGAFTKQEAINKHKNQRGLKRLRKGTKVERTGKWVE